MREWAEAQGSLAAAAQKIPMKASSFRVWLWEDGRGMGPEKTRAVALAVGIPYEAVEFKHERICDLACERARSSAA